MTTGVIWGYWDSLHDGQKEALHKGFLECDDMLVILLIGPEKEKEEIKDFKTRKKKLKKWLKDNNYESRCTYLEYNTVEDAVADAGNLNFDIMILGEHEAIKECAISLKQEVDNNRTLANKNIAPYCLVPVVQNINDEPMCDTKYRKRKQIGMDVTSYFVKKNKL